MNSAIFFLHKKQIRKINIENFTSVSDFTQTITDAAVAKGDAPKCGNLRFKFIYYKDLIRWNLLAKREKSLGSFPLAQEA